VIVVDDGSSDDTQQMVARHEDKLQFFRQRNQDPGAARNLGIKNALGDYIAFLDSDDVWLPWTLQTYANIIIEHNKPGFIVGDKKDFAGAVDLLKAKPDQCLTLAFSDYNNAAQRHGFTILTASSVVVSRTALLKAGGFTEQNMNAEDCDSWLRLGVYFGGKNAFRRGCFHRFPGLTITGWRFN